MTITSDDNKLDPRVTAAIDQSAELLDEALTDESWEQLLEFSDGLDPADRMLVLQRAICSVAAFRITHRRRPWLIDLDQLRRQIVQIRGRCSTA